MHIIHKKKPQFAKRVIFSSGEQTQFLVKTRDRICGTSWSLFAKKIGVHHRTLNNWKREKYSLSLTALQRICRIAEIEVATNIEIRDPFWYVSKGARLGGLRCIQKYGKVGGDPEYRKKKWYEWWEREGKYRKDLITKITKPIKKPTFSRKLAEFTGIVMGDGGIAKNQVTITLHSEDDKEYASFVRRLIEELFNAPVSLYYRKNQKAVSLVVSRTELVRFCREKLGLGIGDKLRQGLDIPHWIKKNITFQKACLRGLVDTDGCIFYERHRIKNKVYSYRRLNFSSCSPHLIKSVFSIFQQLDMFPKVRNNRSVQIEKDEEIVRYFNIIGTHNSKHKYRFLGGYR